MKPLVSVLVNTYNYGRYVEEAIESVLAQRFPVDQMEIIVVDDGSTDDTRARVAMYGKKVQYIYKENGGQMSAYNIGFEHARGEIICFLDSDDYWLHEKVAAVVEEFDRSPRTDVVYHLMDVIDAERKFIGRVPETAQQEPVVRVTGEVFLQSLNRLIAPSSGICVRRANLRKVLPGPMAMHINADAYLHRLLALESDLTAFINTPLGVYRKHGASHPFGASQAGRVRTNLEMHRIIRDCVSSYAGSSALKATLVARLEAEIADTEIVLANLEGRTLDAVRGALRFRPFPRASNPATRAFTKLKMLVYAVAPPNTFERFRQWYRTLFPHRRVHPTP